MKKLLLTLLFIPAICLCQAKDSIDIEVRKDPELKNIQAEFQQHQGIMMSADSLKLREQGIMEYLTQKYQGLYWEKYKAIEDKKKK